MPRTRFLAALRGPDGRSLARALAILLLFSLFAAGLHAGAMADSGGSSVLCATSVDENGPPIPVDRHGDDCCLTGCNPAQPTLAASVDVVPDLPRRGPAIVARADAEGPGSPSLFRHHARGPPLQA